jgi:putative SOS response-associated peptidase YedK
LNARIESLFDEKQYNAQYKKKFDNPFYTSALKRRCVIVADGYYDWHWQGKTSYNFHIRLKSEQPMLLAGIWRRWESKKEDVQRDTVAIVTTDANALCKKVHNRPKASEGPRQLAILDDESAKVWLQDTDNPDDIKEITKAIKVFPEALMKAYPVKKLFVQEGRSRIPLNDPDCIEEVDYPELDFNKGQDQMSLF